MPIAAIALDFDPLFRLGDGLSVRWATIALAVVIFVCLSAAGAVARRARMRTDDLLYCVVGAVPGAVIGGRIGYALLVPDAFRAGPLSLADPAVGGLELGLGVVGGVVTAAIVAAVLGAPVARWAHLLAVVLLGTIAGGKLTMALGGSGQGAPTDVAWATAYLGPGPWGSLAPALASHPSQLYEAVATVLIALVVLTATAAGGFRARDGSRLLVAVVGWALARAAVSVTWRDPAVVGPLPVGGTLAVVVAVGAIGALAVLAVWLPRRRVPEAVDAEPSWPDPEDRPRF
ncbi:MAG: prolipoprotein diacylglyceryl transferase family protein [Candidatus Limnocylindrales bacterium]